MRWIYLCLVTNATVVIAAYKRNFQLQTEIVLGFCIINEDLLDIHPESGVVGSFGLMLVSSGKLKLQICNAFREVAQIRLRNHCLYTSRQ